MPNRFSDAARRASDITNKELATELSVLSNLNREKIKKLLPLKRDKQAFIELMKEVEADTTMDEKLAYLQQNINSAGTVALRLLKALV